MEFCSDLETGVLVCLLHVAWEEGVKGASWWIGLTFYAADKESSAVVGGRRQYWHTAGVCRSQRGKARQRRLSNCRMGRSLGLAVMRRIARLAGRWACVGETRRCVVGSPWCVYVCITASPPVATRRRLSLRASRWQPALSYVPYGKRASEPSRLVQI